MDAPVTRLRGPAQAVVDHLEKVVYFAAIARCGSIQAAARSLGLSQPALSRSVAVLEAALGTLLFHRRREGVLLTAAGTALRCFADKLLRDATALGEELGGDAALGELVIGTHEILASVLWPTLVAKTAALAPAPALSLLTDVSAADLVRQLDADAADIVLVVGTPASRAVASRPFFADGYGFYATPTLAARKKLAGLPLLFMPQAFAGGVLPLAELLEAQGLDTRSPVRVATMESVASLTMAGIGVGVLPTFFAGGFVRARQLAPVMAKEFPPGRLGRHHVTVNIAARRAADKRLAAIVDLILTCAPETAK